MTPGEGPMIAIKRLFRYWLEKMGWKIVRSKDVPEHVLFLDADKIILKQPSILQNIRSRGLEIFDPTRPVESQTELYKALTRAGYEMIYRREGFHAVPDYYGRSFSKRPDLRTLSVFGPLAAEVISSKKTLLYYDRLYILFQCLQGFLQKQASFSAVEIGVYKGGTSMFLAKAAKALGFAQADLHAFDTFEGHAREDIDPNLDSIIHNQSLFSDTSYDSVHEYLKCEPSIHLHKGRFENSCKVLDGRSADLFHLDVDLYKPTKQALCYCSHRLNPGGVLIVDDYRVTSCPGVESAVNEFLRDNKDFFAIQPMTEQCLLINRR